MKIHLPIFYHFWFLLKVKEALEIICSVEVNLLQHELLSGQSPSMQTVTPQFISYSSSLDPESAKIKIY